MFVDYTFTNEITYKHALGYRDIIGKEFHTFHEIYMLNDGVAKVTSDTGIEKIYAKSIVIIPKGCFHQIDPFCKEQDYHRSVIQFETITGMNDVISNVMEEVKVIKTPPPFLLALFEKLNSLPKDIQDECDRKKLLFSYVTAVFMELKYHCQTKHALHNMDPVIAAAIAYIDEHFLEQVSIEDIAKHLNFSASSLAHRFKNIMNISIYNYILKKKLTHAYGLIRSGTPATIAAQRCGFGEYSGFYKLYKKYFGISPAQTSD